MRKDFRNSNYWQKLMKLKNAEVGVMSKGIFAEHEEWAEEFDGYRNKKNVTHENGYIKIEDEQVIAKSEGKFIDAYDGETYLFFFTLALSRKNGDFTSCNVMFKERDTNRNAVKGEAERRNLNVEEHFIIPVSETEVKNLNGIESRKISVTPIIERPVKKNISSQKNEAIQEQFISSSVESLGNGNFDKLIGWNDSSASKRKQVQTTDNVNNPPEKSHRKSEKQSVSNSTDINSKEGQNNSLVASATAPTENNTSENSNLGIIGAIAAVVASAGLVVGKILKK